MQVYFRDSQKTFGEVNDLARARTHYVSSIMTKEIVGMYVNGNNDVITLSRSGEVFIGDYDKPTKKSAGAYTLAPGKNPGNVIAASQSCKIAGVAGDVYIWYDDYSFSCGTFPHYGTSWNMHYNLPPGIKPRDISCMFFDPIPEQVGTSVVSRLYCYSVFNTVITSVSPTVYNSPAYGTICSWERFRLDT